jgi:hypothetical protein
MTVLLVQLVVASAIFIAGASIGHFHPDLLVTYFNDGAHSCGGG